MKHWWRLLFISSLLLSILIAPPSQAQPGTPDYAAQAQVIFDSLSPAERVGQLFLVTFQGANVTIGSDIADLILNYKVGGIVIAAANDNINGDTFAPLFLAELNNALQRLALDSVNLPSAESTPLPVTPTSDISGIIGTPLPLFIALAPTVEGQSYPQILNGLTELPNDMAIGATWDPQQAKAVGQILGAEYSTLGINLLLGPHLDVLEEPALAMNNQIGTDVFGGNAYWVGQMGQAYIEGIHTGARGRMAVVASHFPGGGNSDRPLNSNVATIRKTLAELRAGELIPFFTITNGSNPEATADALQTVHIRYQGLQANVQVNTAFSFDPQAIETVLSLPELAPWRANGGLIVSDILGAQAIRRLYDDAENSYPHRQVATDAFFAGNDLLYLADFVRTGGGYSEELSNIRDTISWFRDKYLSDQSFRQRVDEAVLRIITLKLKLYEGDLDLSNVLVSSQDVLNQVGQSDSIIFNLAQEAVTLLSPADLDEYTQRLPLPPNETDNIVIFTDAYQVRQCSTCAAQPLLSTTEIEDRIIALYGPSASGQIDPERIRSFSFAELNAYLDAELLARPDLIPFPTATAPATPITRTGEIGPEETPESTVTPLAIPEVTVTPPIPNQVQSALLDADWIIFAPLNVRPDDPTSTALRRLLAQRPELVRNARSLVFAFDAPIYLDTTELSTLTAYFAVYSPSNAFVDVAVRALFQEYYPPRGAAPIDVEATGYDLSFVTQPDPGQVIELFFIDGEGRSQVPSNQAPLEARVGDTIRLRTGVINDRNGNPVPDGTLVQFIQEDRVNGFSSVIAEVVTSGGVAQIDYLLEARTGQSLLTILARAGSALNSDEMTLAIGNNVVVIIESPTPGPTPHPTRTPTPTLTPTSTLRPSVTPSLTPTPPPPQEDPSLEIPLPNVQRLMGALVGLLVVTGSGWAWTRQKQHDLTHKVRLLAWGMVGGLALYNYVVMGLPGAAAFSPLGIWTGLISTLVGGALGLGVAYVVTDPPSPDKKPRP
ncbi:MAG: hypothetical protein KA314_15800 [Chloroflexi bacterium]|nr:hypothetical protein [Chloroflexota bacterium]MBP8057299.1 hypothetical protein [Chloroflexota bacterium]